MNMNMNMNDWMMGNKGATNTGNVFWMGPNSNTKTNTMQKSASPEGWTGKGAIVLGANSNVGISIVKKLLEMKMKVTALDTECDLLEELKTKKEVHKGRFHFIKVKFTNEDDMQEALDTMEENLGSACLLVTNVSALGNSPLLEADIADIKNQVRENILGVTFCVRAFIKSARERFITQGHIVNISSAFASRPPKKASLHLYAGLKAALHRLHYHLRQELEYRDTNAVKVTNISPEIINCSTFKDYLTEEIANDAIQPEDIADAIEYVIKTPSHVQVRDIWIQNTEEFKNKNKN